MILVDSGFFYALADSDDAWHGRCRAAEKAFDDSWVTTWPVLTEATHLMIRWLGVEPALALMQDVAADEIQVWDIPAGAQQRIPALMRRYGDLPMDLADASLVLLAESLGHGRVLTTDERDFRTYRWKSRQPFENLLSK
jgi:predicted nucleic acid-binding protein